MMKKEAVSDWSSFSNGKGVGVSEGRPIFCTSVGWRVGRQCGRLRVMRTLRHVLVDDIDTLWAEGACP